MAASSFTISITDMPEAIWALRREMARLLRIQAETDVSLLVAQRLRDIADAFEAGAQI